MSGTLHQLDLGGAAAATYQGPASAAAAAVGARHVGDRCRVLSAAGGPPSVVAAVAYGEVFLGACANGGAGTYDNYGEIQNHGGCVNGPEGQDLHAWPTRPPERALACDSDPWVPRP